MQETAGILNPNCPYSEEVFDFSSDFMTVAKKTKLKNQMVIEFQPVFDLCKQLLHQNTTNSYLRTATLGTLSKFISWIPAEYVFNQELTSVLQQNVSQKYKANNEANIPPLV